jgi:hypothetical protein
MQKKDIGLFVLILVVGTTVAIINPRFLSPINIANTANLIGLFGLFSLAEAFVIITAGIELSVGSVIALLGVIFVDLVVNVGVPWPVANPTVEFDNPAPGFVGSYVYSGTVRKLSVSFGRSSSRVIFVNRIPFSPHFSPIVCVIKSTSITYLFKKCIFN